VWLSLLHVQITIAIAINHKIVYITQKIELCKIDVCNLDNIIRLILPPTKQTKNRVMKKEEVVHLHKLLVLMKKCFEENGLDCDFQKYNELGITPLDMQRSKEEHKRAILSEEVRQKVVDSLKGLKEGLKLVVFTQEFECPSCGDNRMLMEELSAISDKVDIEVLDFVGDKEKGGITRLTRYQQR